MILGRGRQVQDQYTRVEHASPDGTSRQVYRTVVDERARGVFNGLVVVRPDAQRTSAEQSSRNLVLSKDADAHARPQLDINADDVKCSHGATIGALDPAALFYLRSRGIGEDGARRLLIGGFAGEVVTGFAEGYGARGARRILAGWLDR